MFAQFGWEPSKFMNLPPKEKRMLIVFIKQKIEDEVKELEKAKKG